MEDSIFEVSCAVQWGNGGTMEGDSRKFITALKDNDLAAVREVPKADLHNHFVLGGSRA